MKLTVEIQGHSCGQSDSTKAPFKKVDWAAVWGSDSKNRTARAVVFGSAALALNTSIAAKMSKDEVLSSKRMVISLEGKWKSGEGGSRTFWADKFEILDGMALENARLRSEAVSALGRAEKLRKAGQLALAYEAVAEFTANFAGQPLDLASFLSDVSSDDADFGSVAVDTDPEALAAAHFALEDGGPALNKSTDDEIDVSSGVDDAPAEPAVGFGDDDPELGAVDTDEPIAEEAAIELADEVKDVLDDAPVNVKAKEAKPATKSAFVPAGSFKPSAATSKRFTAPNMPKSDTLASEAKLPDVADSSDAMKVKQTVSKPFKPSFVRPGSSPFGGSSKFG